MGACCSCCKKGDGEPVESTVGDVEATPAERAAAEAEFGMTIGDMVEFMAIKPPEARYERLVDMGGVEGMLEALRCDTRDGISQQEVDSEFKSRRIAFGLNIYPEAPYKKFWQLFIDAFKDTTIIILCIAAAISLAVGILFPPPGEESSAWLEGFAILCAVFVVAIVTSVNDWKQDQQFRELNAKSEDRQTKVLRGGNQVVVSSLDLNLGELVVLDTGDQVPGDGIFVSGHNLSADEAVMTGEGVPVKKDPSRPFLLSGTQVSDGVGVMVLTAIGRHSEWGQTLANLATEMEETPLQIKLGTLAKNIGWVGLIVAVIVFVVNMIYWTIEFFVEIPSIGTPPDTVERGKFIQILDFFIISITIVVVAVPEGLPLAVTISLAYSMKQMVKDQNFVRHLRACEIMGGATNICSDKTGTLTENRMTVMEATVGGRQYSNEPPGEGLSADVATALAEGVCINSNATIIEKEGDEPDQFIGSKTECALLVMARKMGVDYREVRRTLEPDVVTLYTFSSSRKRMSVVIKRGNGYRMYSKGASEIILARCTGKLNADGSIGDLPAAESQQMLDTIETWASQGLRTLCLAMRDFDEYDSYLETQEEPGFEPPEDNLILIAVVGIEDPVRPEVPGAVEQCKKAGITVRMITGDNILTAKKIAQECGILTENGTCITGPEFAKLTDDEVDGMLTTLAVMARSSPQDKLRLVERLKANDELVAVTGDGTNDAPALKEAHIGLSMGIMGTEVAKEASDIIILDDNFNSIVKSVMWGRNIFDNISKFLMFQLTVNISALTVAFLGAVLRQGVPLKAIQLLWVNLIMDTMAALALGTEAPSMGLLDRKPINTSHPDTRLITNIMWKHMIGQSVYQVVVLIGLLFSAIPLGLATTTKERDTIIFNAFVFAQICNELNARTVHDDINIFKGFFNNWIFFWVIVVTIIFQIAVIMVPGLNTAFHTDPGLGPIQWGVSIVIGLVTLPLGLILRLIPVRPTIQPRTAYQVDEEEEFDDDDKDY